ncbi:helix-turn-helix domain-containing protein [Nonomuraea dietziae]|uniref:Transcriptional regulator with XRE-family HTH domain n=1 Tax=Nonomuraea dietziae TaxID=65515 RepID=A0A7W5V9R7_9ACTN|nr:helix-turn-helix transcriptional regulator [Nonomuraea dietziae]MBB3733257.1 transcriptional regulator with XRE-family HTH domain [Nonomuraea dietziae]
MVDIDVPIWAARLGVLRRGRLWSQRELAERLSAAADESTRDRLPAPETLTSMIRLWEAGERRPDEWYAELLCRAFGVDEAELFVGDAAGTTLWHYLTGIPLVSGMFTAEEEESTGRAIEAPQRADDRTVGYFRAILDAYTRTDLRPADAISVLRPVFAGIEEFRRDASSPVRRAFLLLATENAELISRLHHEAGNPSRALAWSDEAVRDAREAADALLEAYTLAQRGGLSDTAGDPGGLVDLAVAARERAHLPARVDALSRHHEAQGHALAGNLDMCRRRLEESAQSLAEPGDETPYRFDCSTQAHDTLCAGCLVDLGHARDAIEILEQQPPKAPPTYATAYALARMAHAYADVHECERSVETARQALALARQTGALRALRELAKVHIPPQEARHTRIHP